jgi:hypothetical protein
MLFAIQLRQARSRFDTDELVVFLVRLASDFFAGSKGHQNELCVLSRKEHAPVIFIVQRVLLDVRNVSNHGSPQVDFCRP